MDTEILATSAIKKRIAQTKYLSPFINEKDREPSWDGFIYAYKNESKRKDSLTGRAAVQVKGVQRKSLRQKSVSFRMDKADLENYRADGGIIFFVVCIQSNLENRIYYVSLTPFFLNKILDANGTKKKVTISLRALPDGSDELCNIVFNFIRDSRRQSIVRDGHIWTFDEVANLLGSDNVELNFTYTGIGYDNKNPFSFLSKNDIYMYAQNKEKTITIPIQHIDHMDMQIQEQDARIKIGKLEYIDRIKWIQYSDGKVVLSIGKGISFTTEKGKTIFKFRLTGNLNERIRALDTFITMEEERYICINSFKINISSEPKELKKVNIETKKQQLKYFKIAKKVLDTLNIKEPLEVEKLTAKQENNFRMLIDAILYDKSVSFEERENIPPVCTFEFANLKIVLVLHENEDGRYSIEDFFNTETIWSFDSEGKYQTTPFCILKKEDYLQDSNLVVDKVVKGFKKFDNEKHIQKMVLCILEMVKGYDEDNKRNDLLEAAKDLCLWAEKKNPSDIIHRINYLQCCIRKRKLNDIELKELTDIISNGISDYSILAGIYILLGSKVMAKNYIDKLEEKQRNEFEEYPIYTLFTHL